MALADCQFQKNFTGFNEYKKEFCDGMRKVKLEK